MHGTPLLVSSVPLLTQITSRRNTLPHETHCVLSPSASSERVLRALASEVVVAMRPDIGAWDYCLQACREAAIRRSYDYSPRDRSANQLANDFESHYGKILLEELGLPLLTRSSDAWPVELLRGRRPAMQLQLRFILLRSFLLCS